MHHDDPADMSIDDRLDELASDADLRTPPPGDQPAPNWGTLTAVGEPGVPKEERAVMPGHGMGRRGCRRVQ